MPELPRVLIMSRYRTIFTLVESEIVVVELDMFTGANAYPFTVCTFTQFE